MLINTVVKGKQPTGTKPITANGVYDVTNFASADVQVPTTAPAYYIEKTKDANNVLKGGSSFINLNGVESLFGYVLSNAYNNNNFITGTIDLSSITSFGTHSCEGMCAYAANITGVYFSSNSITLADSALARAFNQCSSLTGSVSLNVKTVPQQALNTCFSRTNITSIDLSSVYMIGSNGCSDLLSSNSSLQQINLGNLKWVNQNGLQYAFQTCLNLSGNMDLSKIIMVDSSGLADMFSGDTKITGLDLSHLVYLKNPNALFNICSGCSMLSTVNVSRIVKYNSSCFTNAFKNTVVSSLSFDGLAYNTMLTDAFQNMLQGVTGCTVHFPADLETKMQSYSSVVAGFGGTNTTVLFDLPSVTTIDASFIESIPMSQALNNCFSNLTSVTSINLSKLVYAIENSCMSYCFSNDSSLTNVDLSSLKKVGQAALSAAFSNSGIQTLRLPALKSYGYNAFSQMLQGVTGCTVHLPSNLTPIPSSGTSTTILYDLPACVTLTGANTTKYERNPKYDTATALAWRIEDTGTEADPIIDWTAFYTNGTTDPVVGDTIYSDAACTTAVTTISTRS